MHLLRRLLENIVGPLRAWHGRLIYGVATRVSPVTPDGTVTADVACRRCGYNLRGLQIGGRCPDCAMPVGASVRGDDLVYADPAWIAKLILGADLLIGGWAGAALAILAVYVFFPAVYVFGSLAAVGILGGTWLLTRPDASGAGEAWYGRSRRLARVLPGLAFVSPVVGHIVDAIPFGIMPADVATVLRRGALYLGLLAGFAALLALLSFVRSVVATRVRDSELADAVRRTFRAIALEGASAGGIFAYWTFVLRQSPANFAGDRSISLALAAASLILIWALVQLVNLALKVRSALKTQEVLARQLWPPPSRTAAPTGPHR